MKRLLPFLLASAAIPFPAPAAGDARWVSMDAPEVLDAPVIGLQRSAFTLPAGFALDTSLIADIGLLPNAGVRWALAAGPHRFVVGARYALFVGSTPYTAVLSSLEPVVKRYDPSYSGPSAYVVYGHSLGQLTLAAEVRARAMYFISGSITAGASFAFNDAWSVVVEGGVRYLQGAPFVPDGIIQPKAAAGLRLAGKGFGFLLGADYVSIDDPMLPALPIIPVVDVVWSFQ